MSRDTKRSHDTLDLPRNFTISVEERFRALAVGPPSYALRLRRVEELEDWILDTLRTHESESGPVGDLADLPEMVGQKLDEMNGLLRDHNRYYPIEANLPIDVRTRQLMDWGRPWVPRPLVSLDELLEKARQ